MKKILIFLALVMVLFSLTSVAFAQDGGTLDDLLALFKNPIIIMLFIAQVIIGFGLGYFSMKALKYILAIVALLIVGVLLNIWQFGGIEGFLSQLGIQWSEVVALLYSVSTVIGIMIVLPVAIGFCLGIIVAVFK